MAVEFLDVGGVPEKHRMKVLQDFIGRSTPVRYGAAVGSVALALLVRMALSPLLGDQLPFVTFFAGIAAAAWFGGVGPSLLSAALGFVLAELFFVHHAGQWWILAPLDLAIAACYFIVAAPIVILTRAMCSARQCAIARQIELEREIGERIQAEEALSKARDELESQVRQRTAELSRAMRAGHSGAFEWDIQDNTYVWSPELEELYGVAPGGFGGRYESWESELLPEDLKIARAAIQESLHTGELRSEWRVRRPNDGQIRWLAAHATVFSDDTGRPLRMVGIHVDVTDRRSVEDALRQSEERYRALVMATSQIVWTTDSNGLMIDSPSWRAFTGQSQDQAKEWGWADALHPDDRKRISAFWSEAVQTQTIFEAEYQIRRRDGEFLDVSARGVPVLRADGSVREWVGICADITERKRAEEALIQRTRELERSNAELQQFAYVASHDLQEPLRVVANFTQLLAERYASQLDEDAREFIAFAVGGAVRMQQLIQDLLAYSRVGTQGRVLEPVDCNEALGRAVSNLRISIAENAALVSHDELPVINADATQLVQLFQNLIGNGIKFRSANPPRVHVSAVRKGEDWIFSLRDNGIGIEPRYAERIFVLFQRLHREEEFSGTGIGLTICKKIVERHGGNIWVESQPGHGSTFFFSIPAAGKKAAAVVEEAEVKHHG